MMEIDWGSMGWFHTGESYTNANGSTYLLTSTGWVTCVLRGVPTNYPACSGFMLPTETTAVPVTITSALTTGATPVPEPSSMVLLGLALVVIVALQSLGLLVGWVSRRS